MDVRALEMPSLRRLLRRQACRRPCPAHGRRAPGPIERLDARHSGYALARAGAWGPVLQREIETSQRKEPLSAALGAVNDAFPASGTAR